MKTGWEHYKETGDPVSLYMELDMRRQNGEAPPQWLVEEIGYICAVYTDKMILHSQQRKGAEVANAETRTLKQFCISVAKQEWGRDATIRSGEMAQHLSDLVRKEWGRRLSIHTVRKYLREANRNGELTVPDAAQKGGRSKKT